MHSYCDKRHQNFRGYDVKFDTNKVLYMPLVYGVYWSDMLVVYEEQC